MVVIRSQSIIKSTRHSHWFKAVAELAICQVSSDINSSQSGPGPRAFRKQIKLRKKVMTECRFHLNRLELEGFEGGEMMQSCQAHTMRRIGQNSRMVCLGRGSESKEAERGGRGLRK